MGLETTDVERKSATLPHTPGRLSLKLPVKDRDARATLYHSVGTPSSPTSTSTTGLLVTTDSMSTPFTHRNPSHANDAFSALNQMRANNEVRQPTFIN